MLHPRSWIEKRSQIFVVTLLSALIGLSIVQIVMVNSHEHADSLDIHHGDATESPVITTYPGFNLEYVEFDEEKIEIVNYVQSDSYKQKLNAGRVIGDHLGGIVFLNIRFIIPKSYLQDNFAKAESNLEDDIPLFVLSDPGSNGLKKREDNQVKIAEIFSMYQEDDIWTSAVMEDLVIMLEHPGLLRNGYNKLRVCPGSVEAILTGFYIFEYSETHQSVSFYKGRLALVDPEKARETVNNFSIIDCM